MISLSTILLFILVFVRLSITHDVNKEAQILSYLISFLIILGLIFIDVVTWYRKKHPDHFILAKSFLVGFMALVVIFIPFASNIVNRDKGDQYSSIHDGIIQTEEAIKYLLAGKNFYSEDYLNTPLTDWSDGKIQEILSGEIFVNPALYHNVYLPFYFLSSAPFYWVSESIFNWYDQRIVLALALVLSVFFLIRLGKLTEKTLLVLILFLFNPPFIHYFIEGRNDFFVLFLIILTAYFLARRKNKAAAVAFALACLSKQSAWLLFPFYFLYLYFQTAASFPNLQRVKAVLKQIYPLFILGAVILAPFLIWDFHAFWEDVFLYPSGKLMTSYPITGYGFSQFLSMIKLGVETIYDYFPFWIIQLMAGAPLLFFLGLVQKRNNTIGQMMTNYGVFLFVFWFFSRFLNDNYIAYLIVIFVLAYFFENTERKQESNEPIT
ncbi:MAG: hypothetical protein COY66_02410 [Candidatus Kerfeldbacteria bacterium CG_4_10_14_0_8_um_filter_42_10]|uniref:Glycosyltransferase RgtA/B/C/D-like domain-containing protein n=1 Tax=Candidatus Kerfeldbacteria bacterium CG_4_10_14_0_8_um_filter_42_10 TaxID=2014248 RepID=A0A2M7RJD3_9BACT|nr:MAG: hypothetical protein COY66_02410 [Candidatus Kerfeldbacteria bacterium CG_4_10_14_0_8_um_filter_42_10]